MNINNNIESEFEFGYLSPYGVNPKQLKDYIVFLEMNINKQPTNKQTTNKTTNSIINKITIQTNNNDIIPDVNIRSINNIRFKKFINKYDINLNNNMMIELIKTNICKSIINVNGINLEEKIRNYLTSNYIDIRFRKVLGIKDDGFVIRYCASEITINKYADSFDSINYLENVDTQLGIGKIGFSYRIKKEYDDEPFIRPFEREIINLKKNHVNKYNFINNIPWYKTDLISKYNEKFIDIQSHTNSQTNNFNINDNNDTYYENYF